MSHRSRGVKIFEFLLQSIVVLTVAKGSDRLFKRLVEEDHFNVKAFNERLKATVADFSPSATAANFANRERDKHGWKFESWRAPFNMTVARAQVARQFPEAARRAQFIIDVNVITGNTAAAEAARRDEVPYREALAAIDRGALPDWMPSFVQTIVGLPDALFFTIRQAFARGWLSIVIGLVTLAIAARFVSSFGIGAIMVLPVFTTLIAWLMFLPVLAAAAVLNWVVIGVFGAALTAPESTAVATAGVYPPIGWAIHILMEHHVTDRLLRMFHLTEEEKEEE